MPLRDRVTIQAYEDAKGGWRWRMIRGSRIVAEGAEGETYARRDSLLRALTRLVKGLADELNLVVRVPTARPRTPTRPARKK